MSIGFILPFSKSTGSIGYFDMTNDEFSAVRQDHKSLLLTNWGERVNHYYFGCNFKEFLFEPIHSDELKSRMADRILSQVQTWLPFVSIDNLNIFLSEDDANVPENGVSVRIDFRLTSKPDLSSRLEVLVSQ